MRDEGCIMSGVWIPPEIVDIVVSKVDTGVAALALAQTSHAWRGAVRRRAQMGLVPPPELTASDTQFIRALTNRTAKPPLLRAMRGTFVSMDLPTKLRVAPYLAILPLPPGHTHLCLTGLEHFPPSWSVRQYLRNVSLARSARTTKLMPLPCLRMEYTGESADFDKMWVFIARVFAFFHFDASVSIIRDGSGDVDLRAMGAGREWFGRFVVFKDHIGRDRGYVHVYTSGDPYILPSHGRVLMQGVSVS